ncbi:RecX family transcriptional regulator [bacterium]|nr:RecX family transcriptional regulator [bacterium]
MEPGTKKLSRTERKERILKFCAYRERCHKEVRSKMIEMGASYQEADEMLVQLIEWNYLNETRYAQALCRGKFLHNNWGKIKINQVLSRNDISPYNIKKGMEEIDENAYMEKLEELSFKAFEKAKAANIYERRSKAARFVITKGYEPDLVWAYLKTLE